MCITMEDITNIVCAKFSISIKKSEYQMVKCTEKLYNRYMQ